MLMDLNGFLLLLFFMKFQYHFLLHMKPKHCCRPTRGSDRVIQLENEEFLNWSSLMAKGGVQHVATSCTKG